MQTEVESGKLKTGSEIFQLRTVYKYVQFLILTDFKSPKTWFLNHGRFTYSFLVQLLEPKTTVVQNLKVLWKVLSHMP